MASGYFKSTRDPDEEAEFLAQHRAKQEEAAFNEQHRASKQSAASRDPDEEYHDLFNTIDTTGDGFIHPAELEAALTKGGKEVKPGDIDAMMKQIDTNNDGKISLEEFTAIFKLAPDAAPVGLQDLFDVR